LLLALIERVNAASDSSAKISSRRKVTLAVILDCPLLILKTAGSRPIEKAKHKEQTSLWI